MSLYHLTMCNELYDINHQLVGMNDEIDEMNDKLDRMKHELNLTNNSLDELQHEMMEWKVFSGIGSWIAHAKFLVLKEHYRFDVDEMSLDHDWRRLVMENGIPRTLQTIKKLFGLDRKQWEILSLQFHKKCRNVPFYYITPYEDAVKLLDHLPYKFAKSKSIFLQLLDRVNDLKSDNNDVKL